MSETGKEFYEDAASYWAEVPATIDGMLGGFAHISETDIRGSKMLLKQLFNIVEPPGRGYALDCGAGIGRITKFLLADFFEKVDLVEQNPSFVESAKTYLKKALLQNKIGEFYPIGLQKFKPEPKKYDLIWIQWVLGHLTDDDFVDFFVSCQEGLKPNGVFVVKENITSETTELDKKDSSVTRPLSLLRDLFEKANLECYRMVKQRNFPKGLYTVYMFVLKPRTNVNKIPNSEIEGESCQSKIPSNNVLDNNNEVINVQESDKKSSEVLDCHDT